MKPHTSKNMIRWLCATVTAPALLLGGVPNALADTSVTGTSSVSMAPAKQNSKVTANGSFKVVCKDGSCRAEAIVTAGVAVDYKDAKLLARRRREPAPRGAVSATSKAASTSRLCSASQPRARGAGNPPCAWRL